MVQPVRMHVRRPDFDPSFVCLPYVPLGLVPKIDTDPKPGFAMTLTFPKLRHFDSTSIAALWNDDSWIPDSLRRNIADHADIDGESLDGETEALASDHDDYFWPHKGGCPVCGSDAYVGFASVECSNGSCSNFVHRAGM